MILSVDLNKPIRATDEADVLCVSEIACAVADEWVDSWGPYVRPPTVLPSKLAAALDALESATRGSPLRKVKP